MKALVTGASGFIGSALIEELGRHGIEAFALMRRSSSASNLEGLAFQRIEGDLEDYDSLRRAVSGMDYVFHLAGAIAAPTREKYLRWNAEGTRLLARAVVESGAPLKKFVFVSSLAAGGPSVSVTDRVESDPDQPVSAYGESKLQAERYLLELRDTVPSIIFRPPMVYGPRDRATLLFVKTVARGLVPVFRGSGSAGAGKFYSTIQVRDLARGLVLGALVGLDRVPSGEVFYLSHRSACSYDELMDTIAARLGKRTFKFVLPLWTLAFPALMMTLLGRLTSRTFPLNLDKLREIAPDRWTCSSEKAKALLGFEASQDIATGWTEAVGWYREKKWI
jgi:nucleoside-diphosphate-sugar epimerase